MAAQRRRSGTADSQITDLVADARAAAAAAAPAIASTTKAAAPAAASVPAGRPRQLYLPALLAVQRTDGILHRQLGGHWMPGALVANQLFSNSQLSLSCPWTHLCIPLARECDKRKACRAPQARE